MAEGKARGIPNGRRIQLAIAGSEWEGPMCKGPRETARNWILPTTRITFKAKFP